jgi:type IV secretory pathway TrbL component
MTGIADANQAIATNNLFQSAVNDHFFNQIFTSTNNQAGNWFNRSMGWASCIFMGLVGLELMWSIVQAWTTKRDIDGLVQEIGQRIFFACFGGLILWNAPYIVPLATEDLVAVGINVAGGNCQQANAQWTCQYSNAMGWSGNQVDIDGIINSGDSIANAFYTKYNAIPSAAVRAAINPDLTATAYMINLGFTFVALQLMISMFQMMITVGGGAFLLGFIGSRWTLPYAAMYPKMLIDSGIKIISVTLMLAIGNKLVSSWIGYANSMFLTPQSLHTVGFSTLLYSLIAWFMPGAIQGMTNSANIGSGLKNFFHGASFGGGSGGSTGGSGGGGASSNQSELTHQAANVS